MRLINAHTLEIEYFTGTSIPNYAILSHTWVAKEATFQKWTNKWTRLTHKHRPSFHKILATCRQARRDGLDYVWVDTVCIDKSSSAELSEAINSMYTWYEKAKICYVYLSDVAASGAKGNDDTFDSLRKSRWFTRGWTLQELIAPEHVQFFTKDWEVLGAKKALAVLISTITGIDAACLKKEKRLRDYSIAQRMTWAAKRETTRVEDLAYCLLGIFGINMPLLYGEGPKAFMRLQEEIIKVSDDHSILAFETDLSDNTLFAHHPSAFVKGGCIHPNYGRHLTLPFSMTNAGLAMTTPLIQTLSPYWVLAVFNCVEVDTENNMQRSQICLPLFGKDNQFMRARIPISLISRKIDDPYTLNSTENLGAAEGVLDLTPRSETSYYISYFGRVYSAYGREIDVAMKGFQVYPQPDYGFMITFPRGMAGYRLHTALPRQDLRDDISFFIPTSRYVRSSGSSQKEEEMQISSGLVVFKNDNLSDDDPSKCVGVYLAFVATTSSIASDTTTSTTTLKTTTDTGGTQDLGWACKVSPTREFYNNRTNAKQVLAMANQEALLGDCPHYHRCENTIVSARTRFQTPKGEPCKDTVMVEIVFDAEELVRERDAEERDFE
ncbi:HET-domain-containing protein [Neurospora crassa]|uniref:HET domain-containing protein n=1 Tax=Neurospora crassa (strain ATCC 24698 / 74-OR23-1A / CBS 708.71 / DSM 1257 / FGSC 987) TaxID=367110 RepID=Q7S3V5_NEUCR|nr:HET domain-containing protein [Neurospora crassa OR74A]EAA30124.1 HET domain-containing protein [Neurospora crassa OR74A]KHE79331.1 HET-domain-containing protein [Neurospora crassa]|eukprot:XP_959360.1 HET domain-containing protein [Neurospora crassa OR74A]